MSLSHQIQSAIADEVAKKHRLNHFKKDVPLECAVNLAVESLGPEFTAQYLKDRSLDAVDIGSIATRLKRDGVIADAIDYSKPREEQRTYRWV
ncbi:hypothetical protein COV17_02845 [Candidatus Woesearchaeota archaeon CG10_big_fil_rev_8_21_14_0_10_36_11]|nr:MAG: hypothetical protein COV17_02845 [Candidatus Woesearchaeota archaeon CG10_big_fil_rev_8_21_14_0_10_36_11]